MKPKIAKQTHQVKILFGKCSDCVTKKLTMQCSFSKRIIVIILTYTIVPNKIQNSEESEEISDTEEEEEDEGEEEKNEEPPNTRKRPTKQQLSAGSKK